MFRSAVLALAALSLAACASVTAGNITLTAKRGATLARASHNLLCTAVETNHASGVLVGAAFNKAKAACIDADDALDAADRALAVGDTLTAGAQVSEAITLLGALQ